MSIPQARGIAPDCLVLRSRKAEAALGTDNHRCDATFVPLQRHAMAGFSTWMQVPDPECMASKCQ